MSCTGRYATAQEFSDFWCREPMCDEDRIKIEAILDIAAADIHVAMAATGMCDCTLADWSTEFLKKLNIIDAEVIQHCLARCGRASVMTAELRRMWLEWVNMNLEGIRKGSIELCAGATGEDFPSMGWAEQSVTDFAAAQIIHNSILRNS
jgi:hypothetical protein